MLVEAVVAVGKPTCIFEHCGKAFYAKRFCGYHYRKFKENHITEDGLRTEIYAVVLDEELRKRKCLIEGCKEYKPLIHGGRFCKRHYNWFLKGDCDLEGKIIRQPRQKGRAFCYVLNCQYRSVDEKLCKIHLGEKREGKSHTLKTCRLCTAGGDLLRGLCHKHYQQEHRYGLIDNDGGELRRNRKTYGANEQCRARGCKMRPKSRCFCVRHYKQWEMGFIDDRGVPLRKIANYNVGKTCSVFKCKQPAHALLMCKNHYTRQRLGKEVVVKRHNKTECRVENCTELGHCKGMCEKHYRKMYYMLNRNFECERGRRKRALLAAQRKGITHDYVPCKLLPHQPPRLPEPDSGSCSERATTCHDNASRLLEAL